MTGHVDLQVNGYAGVDFNADDVTDEQFVAVCDRLRRDECESILATVITAPLPAMIGRINRLASAIETVPEVSRVIAGIHVEGPFISPVDGYVGAHPKAAVMPAVVGIAGQLIDAGRGHVRLLTLAPEMDSQSAVTRFLVDQLIVVAGGHSDASTDQLQRCINAGMTLFTHLGNGCPSILPRHDNIVQRVLSLSDQINISLIADGHHVPFFALANYLRCIPDDRVIIVSDAISAAGLGPGTYSLGEQSVTVDADGAAWAEGRQHFAGCATPVHRMVTMMMQQIGVSEERIDRWTRINPARLLSVSKS
jgi:N-acetylglucosamine-6-phosphate deacetylase